MQEKVITIPANVQERPILRVAAYCRVSSDSGDQLHSFAAQVQHYTHFINSNERMELVDIYADEGITGTKTAKRDDFNRLVADCKKGRIDRVLTKSVSRFARNTADSLMYARVLKDHGVSILFEKENIDTAYMSSEMLLALSGAQAQEESISISKNMRWSIERRMKNGTFIPSSTPYGYVLKDREFHIVEQEAEIVRLIFMSYLSGMGKKAIADMLNEMGAPKRFGFDTWRTNTVGYILSNERYIGDALLQKNFTTDTLPFMLRRNRGQKAQYYVEGTNPPIISKEVYEAAQRLLNSTRSTQQAPGTPKIFSQKMKCRCGASYAPIKVNGKMYWGCRTHDLDSSKCSSQRIPEKEICNTYITMVNKLRVCRADILPAAIAQTERLQMKAGGVTERIRQIDRELAELRNRNLNNARLSAKGIIRPAEYTQKVSANNQKISALRTERRQLLNELDDDSILSGLRRLNDILTEWEQPLTEMDEDLMSQIVQTITVPDDDHISFHLIGGLTITEATHYNRRCRRA